MAHFTARLESVILEANHGKLKSRCYSILTSFNEKMVKIAYDRWLGTVPKLSEDVAGSFMYLFTYSYCIHCQNDSTVIFALNIYTPRQFFAMWKKR